MKVKILDCAMECPISKKQTYSFREYYEEKCLTESPQNIGKMYPDYMDNAAYNKESTLDTIANGVYIESFNLFDILTEVYCLYETDYYFIDKRNIRTFAYIMTKEYDNYIQIIGMWKYKAYHTIMDKLFDKFVLPKFQFIVTDGQMSSQGMEFWKKITKYYLELTDYNVGYIVNGKEYTFSEYEIEDDLLWNDPKVLMFIKKRQ